MIGGTHMCTDFPSLREETASFDEAISGILLHEIATSLRSSQ
ncbi:hypothetical protein RFEPED_1505 [Rickettsia felis str. Pedreira]|uniref:Uncharacterized protein n=1 Tax=Rickettsia felis str. Pedreira TaxID=1359196 RepID=A0A0F3MTW8_RICFI|nr:hypothetical protein RFEPED_1505 [Rickettsia felis str. Pedreira]